MSGLYKENAVCRALGSNCPQIQTFDAEPTHRQYHHAIGNEGKSISSLEPTSDNVITNDSIVRESQSVLLKSSRNPVEYRNMAVLFRHLEFHKTYIQQCNYRHSDDEGKPISSSGTLRRSMRDFARAQIHHILLVRFHRPSAKSVIRQCGNAFDVISRFHHTHIRSL